MPDDELEPTSSHMIGTRTVVVLDAATDHPVKGVQIARVAANGTRLMGETDDNGMWAYSEHYPGAVTLMAAAPSWSGGTTFLQPNDWDGPAEIRVEQLSRGGSLIFESGTGHVPSFTGRLNPIRDAQKRNYIYGDNISFEDSSDQPFHFSIDRSFVAEDAYGARVRLTVLAIVGKTSLLHYVLLSPAPATG